MARKNRLTDEEYTRLVLKDSRRSNSMFESCLLPKHMLRNPKITAHGTVEDSLAADRENFIAKYGVLEAEPEELGEKGAFCTELPKSPQHKKYTLEEAMRRRGPEAMEATKSMQRPKFNIPTLRKWFAEIDADGGGQVSRRELIVAMRNHKDLQAVLLSASANSENKSAADDAEAREDAIQAKNAELRRIMTIMSEVDTDGSGYMDWEEFVEFFRRSGFLLEYDTRKTLNDASFKKDEFLALSAAVHSHQKMAYLTEGTDDIAPEDLIPSGLHAGISSQELGDPDQEGNSVSSSVALGSAKPRPAHLMTMAASQCPNSVHSAKGLAKTESDRRPKSPIRF